MVAWDVASHALLYVVAQDAGGYVRAAARCGWAYWAFSSKSVQVWSGETMASGLELVFAPTPPAFPLRPVVCALLHTRPSRRAHPFIRR